MKIEKLTENKIRIILNLDELAQKNIDIHTLVKDAEASQQLFKKILKQAEKEVGFNISNSKLLIEAFISTEGFFIITFTKYENKSSENVTKMKVKRKLANSSYKNAIYKFNDIETFFNFCQYLNNSSINETKKIAKKIALYEYNSNYFLILSNINSNFTKLSMFYSIVSEFASLSSTSPYFESRLVEYGKNIFKSNALNLGIEYSKKDCLN